MNTDEANFPAGNRFGTVSRRAALGSALAAGAAAATAAAATPAAAAPAIGGPNGENGRIYHLRRGAQQAIVTGVAATLNSFSVHGEETLFTNSPQIMGEAGYQGKTLLPWCNRIKGGLYRFDDGTYQVPVNEVSRNAALHGLLNFVEWSPVSVAKDSVVLKYVAPPQYGYPFDLTYLIEYTLDGTGITCTLSAYNSGAVRAPLTTATHIYVAAPPGGHIDDMTLTLPASSYYLVDKNLIPTGKAPVAGTKYDFRSPRPIGATKMDTCFTDVTLKNGRSTAIVSRPGTVDVELWMDAAHNYYQIYTDDSPSRPRDHRLGMALEPMVGAPNAFNTGDGLVVIDPGSTWRASWGLIPR